MSNSEIAAGVTPEMRAAWPSVSGRSAAYENLRLPADLDYHQVTALSIEVRQKLTALRPETLGQAARISGVTPAAISLLLIHLKRSRGREFALPGSAP